MRRYSLIARRLVLALTCTACRFAGRGGQRAGGRRQPSAGTEAGVALVPNARGGALPSGISAVTSSASCTDPWLSCRSQAAQRSGDSAVLAQRTSHAQQRDVRADVGRRARSHSVLLGRDQAVRPAVPRATWPTPADSSLTLTPTRRNTGLMVPDSTTTGGRHSTTRSSAEVAIDNGIASAVRQCGRQPDRSRPRLSSASDCPASGDNIDGGSNAGGSYLIPNNELPDRCRDSERG